MIKFNYALLLIVLVAFGRTSFSMEADNAGQGGNPVVQPPLDDSIVIVGQGDGGNPVGQNADAQVTNNGAGDNPVLSDGSNGAGNNLVPPPHGDTHDQGLPVSRASFFTRNRIALFTCLGTAACYLFYKYFADKKVQEQEVDEIIVD